MVKKYIVALSLLVGIAFSQEVEPNLYFKNVCDKDLVRVDSVFNCKEIYTLPDFEIDTLNLDVDINRITDEVRNIVVFSIKDQKFSIDDFDPLLFSFFYESICRTSWSKYPEGNARLTIECDKFVLIVNYDTNGEMKHIGYATYF